MPTLTPNVNRLFGEHVFHLTEAKVEWHLKKIIYLSPLFTHHAVIPYHSFLLNIHLFTKQKTILLYRKGQSRQFVLFVALLISSLFFVALEGGGSTVLKAFFFFREFSKKGKILL